MEEIRNLDWSAFPQALRELLAEPGSNLTATVFVVSIISIVLLLVVVGLIAMLYRGGDHEEHDEEPPAPEVVEEAAQPKTPKTPLPTWAFITIIALFVVGMPIAFNVSSRSNEACAGCHTPSVHIPKPGTEDPHAGADCIDCHEGPNGGNVGTIAGRFFHLTIHYAQLSAVDGYGAVADAGCADCHQEILDNTIELEGRSVKVSHKEPVQAGAKCLDCHRVDDTIISDLTTGMESCLRCHNDKTASAECSVCHTGDVSAAIRPSDKIRVFAKRPMLVDIDCSGCHKDQSSCDNCHGLRMPHNKDFLDRGHAKYAAWEKKDMCWRCHEQRECGECHSFPGHGTDWKEQHGWNPADSPCACHAPANDLNKPFCPVCHDNLR